MRRPDHVTFLAAEPGPDDGSVAAQWPTFTNKSYDLVCTGDRTGGNGRLHHIAFAADICFGPLTRLILAPDRRPITRTPAERAKGQAWGPKTIGSFHTRGTPPVGGA
ncbi:hypothetical protein [Amycolatopsis saalfeldensis]|uniref:hypothetical protein n=1 Tax=Amycolatopsis saalfeldensis TaxID=394193 RepID=UPI001C430266|nr:hypothetical protein [Amycolatopsis saalfeldensis]